jgi:trk system potassium uptake protein TrkH
MHLLSSLRIVGILIAFLSISLLPPIAIALWNGEHQDIPAFGYTSLIMLSAGLFMWFVLPAPKRELRARDGFLIVVLSWSLFSLFCAFPFMFSPETAMTIENAFFEAASGLTATGATTITALDTLPRSVLYYRQQLHLVGGMGIIIFFVAILPILGVGGLQLFRAESSRMVKDTKLTPRIAETAKILVVIYLGLNVACILAYWLFGMPLFDAVSYGFATVATGGFAPHQSSFAYYPQTSLRIIAIIFMILGAINFYLHFLAFRFQEWKVYFRDAETKGFLFIQLIAVVGCILVYHLVEEVQDPFVITIEIIFQVVSMATTTGFTSVDLAAWPAFIIVSGLFLGVLGGCAGSTAGGIKTIRILIVLKQGWREMNRLVHPKGQFPLKLNQRAIPTTVSDAVWGFLAMYFTVLVILTLLLLVSGLDFISAFWGVLTCLSNVGPGLGKVTNDFATVSTSAKWIFSFAMIVGRLEVMSVLILLTPTYWRS